MNQHDKYQLHPEQQSQLRNGAIIALVAIALFCLEMLAGCGEKEPLPTLEDQLQGVWIGKIIGITKTYNFHAGACDAYSIIGGQPYQYYGYAYTCQGDTLTLIDLAAIWQPGAGVSRALVTVSDNGDTALVSWLDGVDLELKRF